MKKNYEAFDKVDANFVPLSPISFLHRAETLHSERTAVSYGAINRSWSETAERIRA